MKKHISFLVLIVTILLSACTSNSYIPVTGADESIASKFVLEPGTKVNEMVITTGAEDAIPLWSICNRTLETERHIKFLCLDSAYPRLAIGSTFGLIDKIPESLDWSDLTWEMYLDDYPINLSAFGTRDIVYPEFVPKPFPYQEAFLRMTIWDVVLENPSPGGHVLRGSAETNDKEYSWEVSFIVKPSPLR